MVTKIQIKKNLGKHHEISYTIQDRLGSYRPETLQLMPSSPKPSCFPLSQQQPGCAKTEPQSAKHPSECFPTSLGAAIPALQQQKGAAGRECCWCSRGCPGPRTAPRSLLLQSRAGLAAPFLLTRCSVPGAQDVVTAHVCTGTVKSKCWRVARLAQKPHLLTEEIFSHQDES